MPTTWALTLARVSFFWVCLFFWRAGGVAMQADAIAKEKEAAMLIAQEARLAEAKKRQEAEEAELKIKQEIAAAEASFSAAPSRTRAAQAVQCTRYSLAKRSIKPVVGVCMRACVMVVVVVVVVVVF
jgi:hypothetical protein